MNKLYQKALFIFRRDLRLEDNTGLIFALEKAKEVIPCFIFTKTQIDNNPYRSEPCLQFMLESIEDLEKSLQKKKGHLYLFYGMIKETLEKCIKELGIEAVVVNRDYTPYSVKRDEAIAKFCKNHNIAFHSLDDALLHPPEETLKADGKPYTVFTPFYHNALKINAISPAFNSHSNYYSLPISFAQTSSTLHEKILPNRSLTLKGGRENCLKILKNLKSFSDYSLTRDLPAQDATTHLSSHLKFTTCSIREIYQAILKNLGADSGLIRALYWRDFFTSIAFHFPHVFTGCFHTKYDKLKWSQDEEVFEKWCSGNTGFPIVDAGMRELNETGFMHNRLRMITASFLVKDLHIDWRWGEKYFATKLVDYDPAVNNGNWQWAASTGCDAQPYFRIFNPWLQSAKFDPDCTYIKRWVPELRDLSPDVIHKWYLEKYHKECPSYPSPVLDHTKESKIAISNYKSC